MEWRGRRESTNVEDRRGESGSPGGLGGLGGSGFRLPVSGRGGIGMIVVVLIIAWLTGTNPLQLLGLVDSGGGSQSSSTTGRVGAPTDDAAKFVATVLADTEDSWSKAFRAKGQTYTAPILVLFNGSTRSGCGAASASSGPFYCPTDRKLYLDLDFFRELNRRFGAPGDFAQAYVIAHEVGHHVQNLMGTIKAGGSRGAEGQSVRTELQADCFAGIWALSEKGEGLLDAGDINEAMTAAAAVGDDTLQKRSQGYTVPETFTHGTADQRKRWFNKGFQSGNTSACDTFSANQL